MIFRISAKLGKKLNEAPTKALPPHVNPYADWSAHLFIADRTQYILIANTASLYARVIFGRGITNDGAFLKRAVSSLAELMEDDGFQLVRERVFLPETSLISFSKALNRSVTGSMNELIMYAKTILNDEEISPYDLSFKLNDLRMSYIKYARLREAFEKMEIKQ